jgi:hypothetical protein
MSKTKLEDVVSKAKNSLSNAKSAVNNITAKNGSDTVIPGFSDYAVNAAGQVVSRKTGKVQQIPNGKKKYLIFNDKGERKSIGLDEIKEKTKHVDKNAKAKRDTKYEVVTVSIPVEYKTLSEKEIIYFDMKRNQKAFLLFDLKKRSYTEIGALLNAPVPSIKRDIWKFQTGQIKVA